MWNCFSSDVLLQESEPPKPTEPTSTADSTSPTSPETPTTLDPDQIPLTSLDVVKAQLPAVRRAKDVVIEEMEGMVINGLANLVSLSRA